MTDRLIRITTVMAAAIVAAVAAGHLLPARLRTGALARRDRRYGPPGTFHGRWAHLGGKHADPRCQQAQPARTTFGALEPWCWHCHHDRRQPGSRPRPRPDRCPGQRLARPGAGRCLRVARDPHQSRAPSRRRIRTERRAAPRRANRRTGRTTRTRGCPNAGTNSPSLACIRPQPALHSP